MVALAEKRKRDRKRRSKIWTPGSEKEELAKAFAKETEFMLKKIALENGCSIEELKYTVNNDGVVNVRRATEEEMKEIEEFKQRGKYRKELRRLKGLD